MKINGLTRSVLTALSTSVLLGMPNISMAEDEGEQATQKIVVTGSRIKRVEVEGAAPVTTISAADIKASGLQTIADVLRTSNLNSFGSWGGGANNSWSSQSTVNLKGAGIRYTLVLIDGHRMAKSAVLGGGSANLNNVPTAAVERIEILTDGASAIYGTDAMAGVINIILKKDYEGLQFEVSTDSPSNEGGEYNKVSAGGGISSGKGSITFFYEHDERGGIFDRDRDYNALTQFPGTDPEYLQSYSSLSTNARNIWRSSDGSWLGVPMVANGDCSQYNINGESGFQGQLIDADYPDDRLCGYNYTNESGLWSGTNRDSFMMTAKYAINKNIDFGLRTSWTASETKDISAPSTAFWYFNDDLPGYTTNEGVALNPIFAGDSASYRLNTNGNRIAEHSDIMNDVLLSLDGLAEGFEWQASYQYSRNRHSVWGTGYAMTGAIPDLVGTWDAVNNTVDGWDPRDPNSPIPAGIRANFDKKDEFVFKELNIGASFDLGQLDGGAIAAYIGASAKEESLTSLVDAQAEAGNTAGGNGGSSGSGLSREAVAVFTEVAFPVTEALEIGFAVRYDDYSDFGDNVAPMLKASFRPTNSMMIRASFGKGFFAPTLTDLYRTGAQSFYRVVDLPYYQAVASNAGLSLADYCDANSCGSRETEHHIGGNTNLEAEDSESWNVGYVWDVTDEFGFRADYWGLTIENKISELDGGAVLAIQAQNPSVDISTLLPGARIVRLPSNDPTVPGRISYIDTPTVNFGTDEETGIDLQFNYKTNTDFGSFKTSLGISHIFKYETIDEEGSFDYIGRIGTPDDRLNFMVNYGFENHSIDLYSSWIDGQENSVDGEVVAYVGTHAEHNLTYSYHTDWQATFSLGVRNLTDEEPEFSVILGTQTTTWDSSIYSPQGRSVFATASFEF